MISLPTLQNTGSQLFREKHSIKDRNLQFTSEIYIYPVSYT